MNSLARSLGTTLLCLLAYLLPLHAEPQDRPAANPKTVVVFGDSITEGGALPAQQREQAWVRIVERESEGRLKLVNEGKGGRPTNSVPEFEAMLARQPHADVLVIALGTNDSRDISEQCVPQAVRNVRAMIERARQAYGPATAVLLVGPPNINKSALGPTKSIGDQRETKLRELGEAFAKLAHETGCKFVNLYGVVPDTALTKDGVHPDPSGNAAIARVIRGSLLP